MNFPIGVWFQPPENFAAWKARGCNTVLGPEMGNPPRMNAQVWAQKAAEAGLSVVGNFDFRPPNLLAWFVPIDEPNSPKGGNPITPIAQIKTWVDKFTALDASVPILISLAGDQISNDDAGKTAVWYQQVAALSPRIVFLVNYYVCNRNPERYLPLKLNAKVITRLRNWLLGTLARDVWMAVECSWQRLQAQQPQGRCPTADEMEGEINEGLGAGAKGIVYFPTATGSATLEAGKTEESIDWPLRYDPPVDPSIPARMLAIANRLNLAPAPLPDPVPVVPPLEEIWRQLQAAQDRVKKLEGWMAAVKAG